MPHSASWNFYSQNLRSQKVFEKTCILNYILEQSVQNVLHLYNKRRWLDGKAGKRMKPAILISEWDARAEPRVTGGISVGGGNWRGTWCERSVACFALAVWKALCSFARVPSYFTTWYKGAFPSHPQHPYAIDTALSFSTVFITI